MIIFNYWPGPQGGTERQCRKLCRALRERGVSCTVLTARTTRHMAWREDDDGVSVVRLPTLDGLWRRAPRGEAKPNGAKSPPPRAEESRARPGVTLVMRYLNIFLFQAAAAFFLFRKAAHFDLLHVHTAEWIAGLAVWLGLKTHTPVLCKVATLPALPELERGIPFRAFCDRMRRHAHFVAQNETQAEDLRRGGVADKRVRVIANSVDVPDVSKREPDPHLVLFVSNLTQRNAHKAFDVLFDGWALAQQRCPQARLAVLGAGDAREWEQRLEKLGARASVVFAGNVEDVDAYYRRASLFLLPSRQEGLSNALLESQSWGIPAVLSDIPGNKAVVRDGENGRLVPVNDVAAFAEGIVELLSDEAKREAMGGAAHLRMALDFDIGRIAERIHATYDSLIASGAE